MKCAVIIVLLLLTFTLAEAQPRVDLEKERLELLQVHKADREAHFKTDVDLLQLRSSNEFIAVSEGKIYRKKKQTSENSSQSISKVPSIMSGMMWRSRLFAFRRTRVSRG